MTGCDRVHVLCSAPATFSEPIREPNTIYSQFLAVGTLLPWRHFFTLVKNLACPHDRSGPCIFTTTTAVKRIVGQIVDRFHIEIESLGRKRRRAGIDSGS